MYDAFDRGAYAPGVFIHRKRAALQRAEILPSGWASVLSLCVCVAAAQHFREHLTPIALRSFIVHLHRGDYALGRTVFVHIYVSEQDDLRSSGRTSVGFGYGYWIVNKPLRWEEARPGICMSLGH